MVFCNRPDFRYAMNPLLEIRRHGQQIWLDNLSRTLINDGHLERLISDGVTGITTNPAIFNKAISDGRYYEDDLVALRAGPDAAEARYEQLVIADVQRACDLLRPVHERMNGRGGHVSLEVSPALAHDADGTIAAGQRLAQAVARPNLLIKVPATSAGLDALSGLIAQGISVNVTLMFSLAHVDAVAQAYSRGLESWLTAGGDPARIMSVASLFLSRVDTLVDAQLDALGSERALALRGRTAVAMARLAYQRNRAHFQGEAFASLRTRGALPQYLLWASTGTKNPAYSDLLYVEPLIGPDTVNTLPDATFAALRDHGQVALTLEDGLEAAQHQFDALAELGLDLTAIGERLQRDGLAQFDDAFASLLRRVG